MPGKSDPEHLAHLKQTIGKILDYTENLEIQKMAYLDLAIDKGASIAEVEQATALALVDPEKRRLARSAFVEMRAALEQTGTAAFFEGQLQDLPAPDKPN